MADGEDMEVDVPGALGLALELHRSGNREQAEPLYRAVLELEPENPDALHFFGVLMHQEGFYDEAVDLIRKALVQTPEHADAHNNLGNVLKEHERLEEATACYRRVIELDPARADAHNNLGIVLRARRRPDDAEAAYRRALELEPENIHFLNNLGNLLRGAGRMKEGMELHAKAIYLNPKNATSYQLLGYALTVMGRHDEAVSLYRDWLSWDPGNPTARHLLAAGTGENVPARADDAYIKKTFDNFARDFDERLENLEYRAPQLIAEAVGAHLGASTAELELLDAGCGTGLCGPLLRPFALRLTGVDLSTDMLERARRRRCYDALEEAELTGYLNAHAGAFDLIAAADVLVYFGDLSEVIGAAARALRPRGRLVFTVERADSPDAEPYALPFHGRYVHTPAYVEETLAGSRLSLEEMRPEVLRMERAEPVMGLLLVAQAPA